MTKVEEVARAIDDEPEWPAKTYRQRVARAAIEALRRPTPKMLLAAMPYVESPAGLSAELAFSAMITAALSE